jgi:hypothetical protein
MLGGVRRINRVMTGYLKLSLEVRHKSKGNHFLILFKK